MHTNEHTPEELKEIQKSAADEIFFAIYGPVTNESLRFIPTKEKDVVPKSYCRPCRNWKHSAGSEACILNRTCGKCAKVYSTSRRAVACCAKPVNFYKKPDL